jgi:hypothetical protein
LRLDRIGVGILAAQDEKLMGQIGEAAGESCSYDSDQPLDTATEAPRVTPSVLAVTRRSGPSAAVSRRKCAACERAKAWSGSTAIQFVAEPRREKIYGRQSVGRDEQAHRRTREPGG